MFAPDSKSRRPRADPRQTFFKFAGSVCTENDMLKIENLALRAEVARLNAMLVEASVVMRLYSDRILQAAADLPEPHV